MKRRLPIIFLAFMMCAMQAGLAQRLALAQGTPKPPVTSRQAEKPLKELIQSLKEHYKTDIIFFDRIVEGKTAPANAIEWNSSLEKNLNRILKPFGLETKKGRNGGFIITSGKPGKEINYQAEPVEQPGATVSLAPRQSADPMVKGDLLAGRARTTSDVTVRGRVVDAEKNEPLPGVSVVIKNSQKGAITDVEGNYSLDIPENAETLVFSFVGYMAQEIPVGGRTLIDVSLKIDQKSLEEVLVIGYGTQERATITGSVVSVKGSEIVKTPVVNVSNALVGRLPGVTAVQRSGEPGSDGSEIRIRGTNSLGNNNPLVIVDGIPGRSWTALIRIPSKASLF